MLECRHCGRRHDLSPVQYDHHYEARAERALAAQLLAGFLYGATMESFDLSDLVAMSLEERALLGAAQNDLVSLAVHDNYPEVP